MGLNEFIQDQDYVHDTFPGTSFLQIVDINNFNKHKKDLLNKMGFLDKKTGNFGFLVKNSNSEIENILFNDENTLDMSLTDGDAVFSL